LFVVACQVPAALTFQAGESLRRNFDPNREDLYFAALAFQAGKSLRHLDLANESWQAVEAALAFQAGESLRPHCLWSLPVPLRGSTSFPGW